LDLQLRKRLGQLGSIDGKPKFSSQEAVRLKLESIKWLEGSETAGSIPVPHTPSDGHRTCSLALEELCVMAYEFVEAFSSVPPRIRITQIIAILGILADIVWRLVTGNFSHPSFVDIPAAVLLGFYLGKRPRNTKRDEAKKSKWIRLS
jgi:hypothetical protein